MKLALRIYAQLAWPQARSYCFIVFYFIYFWPSHLACGIFLPQPGTEPMPPAVGVWSFNNWTSREVPRQASWKNNSHSLSAPLLSHLYLDSLYQASSSKVRNGSETVGPKAYTVLRSTLRRQIMNYDHEIRNMKENLHLSGPDAETPLASEQILLCPQFPSICSPHFPSNCQI